MQVLHPIILVSFPGIGDEIIDEIITKSIYCNHNFHSTHIKHIKITDTGNFSCNSHSIDLGISLENGKEDNFTISYNNRSKIFDFFNTIISEVYNVNNENIALNNNFSFDQNGPKVIFLTNLTNPLLLPIYFTVLRNRDSFNHTFTSVSLLLTTQNNINTSSKEELMFKVAFFKEIEAFNQERPIRDADNIWLADTINDKGISLDSTSVLYKSIAHFIDILYFNKNSWLESSNIEEQGKSCLYSSFGVSTLIFPVDRVKEYMKLYISSVELSILISSFDTKFSKSIINSSLGSFFRNERWTDIHTDINKNDQDKEIYQSFNFSTDVELENEIKATSSYNLEVIDSPKLLAKETTVILFSQLEQEQEIFSQKVESEYLQALFRAKERELKRLKNSIVAQIDAILDKDHRDSEKLEGINYAILFCSLLNNDESEVMHLISDSTHVEYENLYTIQDKIRELFLGDELRDLEKKEKIEKDDFTDKKKLIGKYRSEIISNSEALEKLKPDSARFIELTEDNKSKEKDIDNLSQEIIIHEKNIKDYSDLSNNIRLRFNRDDFRRSLRDERNAQYDEADELYKESIEANDNNLTEQYEQKNKHLEIRKKILFRDVFLIPSAVLIIFILINVLLFYKVGWFYDFFRFFLNYKYRLLISVLIPSIFLIKGGLKLYSITKKLKNVIISIKKYQQDKAHVFLKLVNNFDDKIKYNFSFDKNIYAYNMLEETIQHTKNKIRDLKLFKQHLIDKSIDIKKEVDEYKFSSSSFDFCVFKNKEIESICDDEQLILINNKINFNLSNFFLSHFSEHKGKWFDDLISNEVDNIYERKISGISVTDILLNQANGFDKEMNIKKEVKRIYNNSRALLKTPTQALQPGVPKIKDITVGAVDQNIYNDHFTYVGLNNINYNESLDTDNIQRLGILSVKSNIPSFFIHDLTEDEQVVSQTLEIEKSKYFTREDHSNYLILPISNSNNHKELNKEITDGVILLLLNNIITYSESNFYHNKLKIASDFHALVGYIISSDGVELYNKKEELLSLINNWSEAEENDFISLTSRFFEANRNMVQQNRNYFERFLLDELALSDSNFKKVEKLLN